MTEETKLPESEVSAENSDEQAAEEVVETQEAAQEEVTAEDTEHAAEHPVGSLEEEEVPAAETDTDEPAEEAVATNDAEEQTAPSLSESDFAEMMEIKNGDIVKGKIVKIETDQVYVDVGYKYDGIITRRELSPLHITDASEVTTLDQDIECKVLSIDDENERLLLSKRAVDSERAWDTLQTQFESQEIIEVEVAEVVKGGLVVDLGVRGFIPASMVERHFVEDFSDYKGRTLRVIVKEIDREDGRLILSQRDVLDQEYEQNKQEVLNRIEAGDVIEGTVQRLTPFGAFVDIGGVDGLVHISEMAWEHVEHPSDVVQEGATVTVKVLKVSPENERISLSMKATQPGPWEQAEQQFNIGDVVEGQVKRLVSFGAFVEIMPGVEGLVHISQISHQHIGTPHEVLEEGQTVNVKILDIRIEEKRISLSIKETQDAPADRFDERDGIEDNENVSVNNQGLSMTLGERFGDQLSKFK